MSSRRLAVLVALVFLQVNAALGAVGTSAPGAASLAAASCAALAVLGLRSVPLVWVVRGSSFLTGVILLRFGALGAPGGWAGVLPVVSWLAATAMGLALAPSTRPAPPAAPGAAPVVVVPAPPRRAAAATLVICAIAILLAPRLPQSFDSGSPLGNFVDPRDSHAGNPLEASSELDMTRRPKLSDRVVMTVESPVASYWRTETFDAWDGSRWTRSYGSGGTFLDEGRVLAGPDDIAAREGVEFEAVVRIETGFANALPVPPSPVRVDAEQVLAQRPDGSIVASERPLGRGSSYRVTSRRMSVTPALLRSAAGGEAVALDQGYTDPLPATPRTRRLAAEITDGIDNDFDKVIALQSWLSANTTYSIDAPLSPPGDDVVDRFLFEDKVGWCEQIASSLAVMARLAGVPTRVVAGYAPGDFDTATGRFVVREREAHAWVEVWFAGVGWVPFDPTADVPSGDDPTEGAGLSRSAEVLSVVFLAIGLTILVAPPVAARAASASAALRRRWRLRRLSRRRWDVAEELAIEQFGRRHGRSRRPDESLTAYSRELAAITGDGAIAARGERAEAARYGRPASGAGVGPESSLAGEMSPPKMP